LDCSNHQRKIWVSSSAIIDVVGGRGEDAIRHYPRKQLRELLRGHSSEIGEPRG
jgi:uncharacterized protein (DUF779 family)